MKGKTAGFVFLGICVILAVLLLAKTITPLQRLRPIGISE